MDKLKKACETKMRTLESVIAEADGELRKQEPSLEMLMSLRPKLLRYKDRFLIASDCLIEQLIKADKGDEEIEDVDIVQANLFGKSEGVLQKMEQLLAKPTVNRESIVSGGNEGKSNLHRLPKLELPKFGGEAREWLQFWSAFQSVHDDDSISACVKFQYLQNCMIKGSVSEEIVSSFPNSAANYPLTISTLKERFGREDMLVEVYLRDLIAIILENAYGRNTTSFSTLYIRLSLQLRALGSLGVTTDKCAAILYPMVESALPEDLFVAWERTRHHHKPDEDGKHKSILKGSQNSDGIEEKSKNTDASVNMSNRVRCQDVLLQTIMVKINGENKSKVVRAILDSGSQNSYILEQTASEVGLTMLGKKEVVHLLFGGVKSRPQQHKRYRIYISDVDSKYNCNFEVQECSTICSAMPSAQPAGWMTELRSKGIDFDVYRPNAEIELLLGADVYAKLLTGKKIELESGPVALETKLGWTVSGKVLENVQITESQSSVLLCLVRDATIQDFWRLDVIGGHPPLPNYKLISEKKLESTTARLEKLGVLSTYHDVIKSWEDEGIIERVDSESGHVLSHHGVIKPESQSTPVRPVFNASFRTKGNPSLNDCLEVGPNMLENIPDIVTRFRLGPVAVTSDIRKAFLQIEVAEEDRNYLQFWWYKNQKLEEKQMYRHCRVVFGVSSSPFLLAAVIDHHLSTYEDEYKKTIDILRRSMYVDNCVASVGSKEDALKFKEESVEIFGSAKMDLREWEIGPSSEEKQVPVLEITQFSNYHKILRIVAYWRRFLDWLQRKRSNKITEGPITMEEMTLAEERVIRLVQQCSFEGVKDKKFKNLRVYEDKSGLLRVKCRFVPVEKVDAHSYPMVMPSNGVTGQLIWSYHRLMCHAGVQSLHANLRERYWILNSRRTIRNEIRPCARCRRFRAQPCYVEEGPLPKDRVRVGPAFDVNRVDMTGPLHLKGNKKCWIAIFTCATYRAIHLELCTSFTTEHFLYMGSMEGWSKPLVFDRYDPGSIPTLRTFFYDLKKNVTIAYNSCKSPTLPVSASNQTGLSHISDGEKQRMLGALHSIALWVADGENKRMLGTWYSIVLWAADGENQRMLGTWHSIEVWAADGGNQRMLGTWHSIE
ncbi:hypothetical protein LAZ67_1005212, partial [Cordylochernes scorpioides]